MRGWRCGAAFARTGKFIPVLVIWLGLLSSPLHALPAQTQNGIGESADDLVRATVQHEIASDHSAIKHMFRSWKQDGHGTQTHLYAETTDATADLLIATNGKPLPEQQMKNQLSNLTHLARSPQDLNRKRKQEAEDADRSHRIMRALPAAFLYQYDGTQQGNAGIGKPGDQLIRLKFRPNPNFVPPTHVERVLLGMQGHLLIDKSELRIAEIDATLFKDVTFGWGFLGRLDQGGSFFVDQADVGDGVWELTRQRLNFNGKIMMVKGFSIKSDEVYSGFRLIPTNTDFERGIQLLEAQADQIRKGAGRETANASRAQ